MSHREEKPSVFTPFWPLVLLSVSLALFLGWQVAMAMVQQIDLIRLQDRQAVLSSQAAQAETKLESVIFDLLSLSKTDSDAKAVVEKYGIKFNPEAASSGTPKNGAGEGKTAGLPSESAETAE
ncbi:MAG: hypothetical protein WCL44_00535 [bacterium]